MNLPRTFAASTELVGAGESSRPAAVTAAAVSRAHTAARARSHQRPYKSQRVLHQIFFIPPSSSLRFCIHSGGLWYNKKNGIYGLLNVYGIHNITRQ